MRGRMELHSVSESWFVASYQFILSYLIPAFPHTHTRPQLWNTHDLYHSLTYTLTQSHTHTERERERESVREIVSESESESE